MSDTATALQSIDVDGVTLGYRERGSGPTVLLLHGWPTSSHMWRNVMIPIARSHRVIALDMPGFGASDKPVDGPYDFVHFARAIDGALAALEVNQLAIAAHDIGGPIAVRWALDHPERVTAIAMLNTLLYPEFSPAVIDFVTRLSTPDLRDVLTSPEGLAELMREGLADEANLTDELRAAVLAPFATPDSRLALSRAGIGLSPELFADIGNRLGSLEVPVRVIYGEQDRILPDVAETFARVARDLPSAQVTALSECGHFLTEEDPDRVGELLAEFFATRRW